MTAHGVSDAELRRRYGQVFDGVAEEYDRERPSYPPELIETAMKRGALSAGDPVVEVGCGTGLLTAALLAQGLRVDAVDPGENMIRLARRRVGAGAAVRFHHGRFEDVALPLGAFAAVFSATAFHWVEPEIGWARAAGLLRPGGVLALLQYSEVADERTDEDRHALHAALVKVAPDIAAGWPGVRDAATIVAGAADRRDNISAVWSWMGRHDLTVAEAARAIHRRASRHHARLQRDDRRSAQRVPAHDLAVRAARRRISGSSSRPRTAWSPSAPAAWCGRASSPCW